MPMVVGGRHCRDHGDHPAGEPARDAASRQIMLDELMFRRPTVLGGSSLDQGLTWPLNFSGGRVPN